MSEFHLSEDARMRNAAALTAMQISSALDLIDSCLRGDPRGHDPAVLAAVIQALATNYATENSYGRI